MAPPIPVTERDSLDGAEVSVRPHALSTLPPSPPDPPAALRPKPFSFRGLSADGSASDSREMKELLLGISIDADDSDSGTDSEDNVGPFGDVVMDHHYDGAGQSPASSRPGSSEGDTTTEVHGTNTPIHGAGTGGIDDTPREGVSGIIDTANAPRTPHLTPSSRPGSAGTLLRTAQRQASTRPTSPGTTPRSRPMSAPAYGRMRSPLSPAGKKRYFKSDIKFFTGTSDSQFFESVKGAIRRAYKYLQENKRARRPGSATVVVPTASAQSDILSTLGTESSLEARLQSLGVSGKLNTGSTPSKLALIDLLMCYMAQAELDSVAQVHRALDIVESTPHSKHPLVNRMHTFFSMLDANKAALAAIAKLREAKRQSDTKAAEYMHQTDRLTSQVEIMREALEKQEERLASAAAASSTVGGSGPIPAKSPPRPGDTVKLESPEGSPTDKPRRNSDSEFFGQPRPPVIAGLKIEHSRTHSSGDVAQSVAAISHQSADTDKLREALVSMRRDYAILEKEKNQLETKYRALESISRLTAGTGAVLTRGRRGPAVTDANQDGNTSARQLRDLDIANDTITELKLELNMAQGEIAKNLKRVQVLEQEIISQASQHKVDLESKLQKAMDERYTEHAQLKGDFARLTRTRDDLKDQLDRTKDTLLSERDALTRLRVDYARLEKTCFKLRKEREAMEVHVEDSEELVNSMKEDVRGYRDDAEEANRLHFRTKEHMKRREALMLETQIHHQELVEMNELHSKKIDELRKESLQERVARLEAEDERDKVQHQMDMMMQEFESLKRLQDDWEQVNSGLRSANERLRNDASDARDEARHAAAQVNDLTREIQKLTGQVDVLADSNYHLGSQLRTAERSKKQLLSNQSAKNLGDGADERSGASAVLSGDSRGTQTTMTMRNMPTDATMNDYTPAGSASMPSYVASRGSRQRAGTFAGTRPSSAGVRGRSGDSPTPAALARLQNDLDSVMAELTTKNALLEKSRLECSRLKSFKKTVSQTIHAQDRAKEFLLGRVLRLERTVHRLTGGQGADHLLDSDEADVGDFVHLYNETEAIPEPYDGGNKKPVSVPSTSSGHAKAYNYKPDPTVRFVAEGEREKVLQDASIIAVAGVQVTPRSGAISPGQVSPRSGAPAKPTAAPIPTGIIPSAKLDIRPTSKVTKPRPAAPSQQQTLSSRRKRPASARVIRMAKVTSKVRPASARRVAAAQSNKPRSTANFGERRLAFEAGVNHLLQRISQVEIAIDEMGAQATLQELRATETAIDAGMNAAQELERVASRDGLTNQESMTQRLKAHLEKLSIKLGNKEVSDF